MSTDAWVCSVKWGRWGNTRSHSARLRIHTKPHIHKTNKFFFLLFFYICNRRMKINCFLHQHSKRQVKRVPPTNCFRTPGGTRTILWETLLYTILWDPPIKLELASMTFT